MNPQVRILDLTQGDTEIEWVNPLPLAVIAKIVDTAVELELYVQGKLQWKLRN